MRGLMVLSFGLLIAAGCETAGKNNGCGSSCGNGSGCGCGCAPGCGPAAVSPSTFPVQSAKAAQTAPVTAAESSTPVRWQQQAAMPPKTHAPLKAE